MVIGVHSPEFPFERDIANVRRAAKQMMVDYPIAVDSDHRLWRAFHNQYWPALYLVDAKGRIRHHHFGEGEYERSEQVIQQLLADAGARDAGGPLASASVDARGIEAAADWRNLQIRRELPRPRAHPQLRLPRRRGRAAGGVCTPCRRGCSSISGPCRATGRLPPTRPRSTRAAGGSHTASTPGISIWSMGPPAGGAPVRFRILDRRTTSGVRSRQRRRRRGPGNGIGAALVSTHPAPRRRSMDRDFEIEFLDSGRRGLRLYLRLSRLVA